MCFLVECTLNWHTQKSSNRLSAIRNADRILFIEKGKIVEDGTHDELIKLQGSYYHMMRSNNIDNDNILQNNLDVDNEKLPSSKLVEKQMFAESKQIQDNQTGRRNNVTTQRYGCNARTKKLLIWIFHTLPTAITEAAVESPEKQAERIRYWSVFARILSITRPEWLFLLIAFICAIIIGASIPTFSILSGEFYGALAMDDPAKATKETNSLCLAFLLLGILIGTAAILQTYMFNMAGVYLTTRIR